MNHLGVDVNFDVGRGGGVVPEGEGSVAVEDGRDGEVVVEDPGDVGRRAETPDDPPVRIYEMIVTERNQL